MATIKKSIIHKIYIYGIFLLALVALFLLMPHGRKFKFEYQKGKPWKHETLYAPFDFAISKSKQELDKEKDKILSNLNPYFYEDNSISKSVSEAIQNDIHSIVKEKDPLNIDSYNFIYKYLVTSINDVYNLGVLEQSPENIKELKNKDHLIKIIGNKAITTSIDSVYSLKEAYTYVHTQWDSVSKSKGPIVSEITSNLDLSKYIYPSLKYDSKTSNNVQKQYLDNISLFKGLIQEGEVIVTQGEIVTLDTYTILESLKNSTLKKRGSDNSYIITSIGKILFLLACLMSLFFYTFLIYKDAVQSIRNINLLLTSLVLLVLICRITLSIDFLNIYIVPLALFPIFIHTFIDQRIAIFSNAILAIIVGFMAPNSYEFVIIQYFAGTVAVVNLRQMQKRSQLVLTAFFIFVSYSITYLSLAMIQEGNIINIEWNTFKWFGINSVLILLAQPLGYICEKFFGFVSDITLIELSDTNHPLLRKLMREAPGTFQHTIQVANLAEQAILQIGGNPHLTRAGALYHDIGKTHNPLLFTENIFDNMSPHSQMSYKDSAKEIIKHVTYGEKLAKEYNLPQAIIDFIVTHHGTSQTGYFYIMSVNKDGKENTNISDYTYPGPNPTTRETAVVMLTDSIEAATKSIKNKTPENVKEMIVKIFDSKMKEGLLDNTPLTLQELSKLKTIFQEQIGNIYHMRISYPEEKNKN